MKQSRFSETQIVGVLKQAEAGVLVKELYGRIGINMGEVPRRVDVVMTL